MNWWGNSLDKAVGFSNYATNALKTAQKKIDKVLEIPTVDDFKVNDILTEKENVVDQENTSASLISNKTNEVIIPLKNEEFSEIDLTSPPQKHDEMIASRCGDWNIEESLTTSQFENFHTSNRLEVNLENVTRIPASLTEKSASLTEVKSPTQDNNAEISEIPQESSVLPTRFSYLSMSSDCTIKRPNDEMDSSDHTGTSSSVNFGMVQSSTSEKSAEIEDPSIEEETEAATIETIASNATVGEKEIDQNNAKSTQICKDDMDSTTTSSDIELVSCATSNNGDNNRYIGLIPPTGGGVVAGVSTGSDYMKHQRSASGSSMSICKLDNYYYTDEQQLEHNFESYQFQLNEINKKLECRENKMIQLSRENIDLRETINNLTKQIEQMNEHESVETTDITTLTKEFTTRLNDAERRSQLATKERDHLKKQLQEIQSTEAKKIENVIKDKEDQVANLLLEGEKLAQDQLKANTIIKKLRMSIKEKEVPLNAANQKIGKFEAEIAHLKKVLDNKEDNERKHVEGINQLTKVVEKLEKENSQYKNQFEIIQERNQSLDKALKKSNNEVISLGRNLTQLENDKINLEKETENLINQHETRADTLSDFQMKLSHNEQEIMCLQNKVQSLTREFSYKEEEYNARINYLQNRLGETQQLQDDASEAATQASKPLLRQLEAIQNSCATHTSNWEQTEHNLNSRLRDLQQKLQQLEESSMSDKDQLINQEVIINSLRDEKIRLLSQYKQEYNSKQNVIDEKIRLQSSFEEEREKMEQVNEKLENQVKNLEFQLNEMKHELELEKQNSNNMSARLISMQLLVNQQTYNQRSRINSSTSTVTEVDPDDSISLQSHKLSNKALSGQPIISNNDYILPSGSLSIYDSVRQQGVAGIMEHLEASLKQRDGQITKLTRELKSVCKSRESLMEEMTNLTQTIDELRDKLSNQQSQMETIDELNQRYDALLQMYGEKMDECDELKLDLVEIKDVYRSHIDMLSKTKDSNL